MTAWRATCLHCGADITYDAELEAWYHAARKEICQLPGPVRFAAPQAGSLTSAA